MNNYPRLIIAGVRGGSGKTTLSLGVIAALRSQKGMEVVPFKKGPDFIDAGWLSVAAKNPCYNLDPFLIPKENILNSFTMHFTGDIAVIEGNRGLYDGMDAEGSYSTAELAKLLKSPVILIVDCTKMTRTAAAIVLGCIDIDRDVSIKGIVLNQVAGSRHESVVRASIERYCSVPVIGAIPRLNSEEFPERHMGLTPYHEHHDVKKAVLFAEDIAKKYIDIDRTLSIAMQAEPLNINGVSSMRRQTLDTIGQRTEDRGQKSRRTPDAREVVRIGVIRDSAFQFYYPENIEELQKNGADIIEVNALEDNHLPDIDALYIGGGFPETNAIRLAKNKDFRESVFNAAEKGLPIYAECGGLMFLGESIVVGDNRYPMVGIFPITFEMRKKPQAHGYTIVEVEKDNPFYPIGTVLHGHEFHYSAVNEIKEHIYFAFKMKRGHGIKDKQDGICYKNVFATYTHVHALGAEEWVKGLINKAKEFKEAK
ncbi:cobyrinic acid a,c-diamide synthase [Dissulfurispira thermophila]|uniref:Cobyrinate a,c-diamide synthase n=1 Tax=Dissulfurispira thermophila TaxID=2715679 RepID=A0A7G1H5V8_9BACT|nr:cobyrinate a,c-diamide synthase [Dissulfurispira thermophila]BCB97423.1 cobyrinic acid a,c-diamide synthase [Dissulfurispira thermophila]